MCLGVIFHAVLVASDSILADRMSIFYALKVHSWLRWCDGATPRDVSIENHAVVASGFFKSIRR